MCPYTPPMILTPRLVLFMTAMHMLPLASAEKVCVTDRFGYTTCRSPTVFYIKLAVVGGLVLLSGIGFLVYLIIWHRRRKEMDAIISEMEPSQIQGPPPTTYGAPPPNINAMSQIPSTTTTTTTSSPHGYGHGHRVPYSASPYGMNLNPFQDSHTSTPNGTLGTEQQQMMFAGPSGTPHYPNSAFGDIHTHLEHPQIAPLPRRRSTDDGGGRERPNEPHPYPFVGYSSIAPPSPVPAVVPSTPSYPEKPMRDV